MLRHCNKITSTIILMLLQIRFLKVMGALTLKSFPFELRGWDIISVESLDPTDGFGSSTKIYIHKNQVIQIEPNYDFCNMNSWLTDRGRHFFDGIFNSTAVKSKIQIHWLSFLNSIIWTIYIFDQCAKQNGNCYYFTIVFNHLNIETLNILLLITQNYSFVRLRRVENLNLNINLESNFQINTIMKYSSNNGWNLCILISTNPRYEGYQLNLNLWKKTLKHHFQCLTIGSIINLTFPTTFLGSNISVFKTIAEGNNFICQHIKYAANTFLLYNSKMLQRNNGKSLEKIIKTFNNQNIFNKIWSPLNILNSGLSDTGTFILNKFSKISTKDLTNFSVLYFLNTNNTNDISNLKKITELRALKSLLVFNDSFLTSKRIIHHNYKNLNLVKFFNKISTHNVHVTATTFYENKGTFINTMGFIKRTAKLIHKNKSEKQIFKKLLKQFKTRLNFLNQRNCKIAFPDLKSADSLKNIMNLHYRSILCLYSIGFYLGIKNNPVHFEIFFSNFKTQTKKLICTKLKFWLNDFYNESCDEYTQNSKTLNQCSTILWSESTNFF